MGQHEASDLQPSRSKRLEKAEEDRRKTLKKRQVQKRRLKTEPKKRKRVRKDRNKETNPSIPLSSGSCRSLFPPNVLLSPPLQLIGICWARCGLVVTVWT